MVSQLLPPRHCMINGRLTQVQSSQNGTPTSKVSSLEPVLLSAHFPKELKFQALKPLLPKLKDSSFWVSSEPI